MPLGSPWDQSPWDESSIYLHLIVSNLLVKSSSYSCSCSSDELREKCVMNNYFGIGLDAKISLDFHTKREEHPEKCRSRTKNMMWYGVLGGREIVHRTYKNLEQRVRLECDGQLIPLPNLQGIVVLNIPRYGSFSTSYKFSGLVVILSLIRVRQVLLPVNNLEKS